MNVETISTATEDLRYLLDRGYPRATAVNFVANHFRLNKLERHFLTRCVFSRSEAESHKKKLVGIRSVKGKLLGVDGYNVLITIESLVKADFVVKCDDGLLRDLRGIFGKYRMSQQTLLAIKSLVRLLKRARPRTVMVFFDKQVSRSGELAGLLRKEIRKADLSGDAGTVKMVDTKLRDFEVVSSSDRVVIERARKIWDIPGDFARATKAKVFNTQKIRQNSRSFF